MSTVIINILKKVDPKWLPAIFAGLAVIGSIIYLIYCKRRAESLNEKLKVKLALAEADALNPQIEASRVRVDKASARAADLDKDILKLKDELNAIKVKSEASKNKILLATSWEDLDL